MRKKFFAMVGTVAIAGAMTAGRLKAQNTANQSPAPQSPAVPQWQTNAGGKMAFEVASVKQNKSGDIPWANIPLTLGSNMSAPGGLMLLTDMPLRNIIGFAYKISVGQTRFLMPGLPNWVDSESFDIEARAADNPTKDQFRLMVQALLADRFKLTIRQEMRKLPIFALLLSKPGKTGPQLTPHIDDSMCVEGPPDIETHPYPGLPPFPCGSILFPGLPPSAPGRVKGGGRNLSLDYIAAFLTGFQGLGVDRPVVNRTGLTGSYDFWMELVPLSNASLPSGTQPDATGPTVLQALDEQLGLKLERQMGPVDVLVVDHIEEPSAN